MAAWTAVATVVGMLIGRMIRRRDRQAARTVYADPAELMADPDPDRHDASGRAPRT